MTTEQHDTLDIMRAGNFGFGFGDYHEGFKEVHEVLHKPKFTVGDTGVPYRVIHHWEENNLLPGGFKNDGGWRLFSLVEMAWLRIICHLRLFGMSLEQIKKAKNGIIAWDLERKKYDLFEFFLSRAVASDLNTYAIVDRNGRAGLATEQEVEIYKFANKDPDLLLISLKGIVRELGFEAVQSKMLSLSDMDIAENLSGDVKEIKIGKKKSGEKEVETTEVHPADSIKDIQKRLRDSGAFGEVTIKYENGKEQSAEVKVRKRIKN